MSLSLPSRKRLHVIQLAAVIFFTVSGGPYGLEPLLTYAGKHIALVLMLVTPLLWDIPAIFTVFELNSMMPVTGGYYQWVKRALGLRWGFYEGWWTWLYTFVDLAIYPVLFVEYASFFFPQVEAYKIPICLVIIWAGAILNILGIAPVGKTALVLSFIVLTPFIILLITSIAHHSGSFSFPSVSFKGLSYPSLGMALYTVMWNFFGWDNTTTYAEEVDRPVRSYVLSTAIAFVTVYVLYFIVIFFTINSGIDPAKLNEQGFPVLGLYIGGQWLGALLSVGGMASALGLFSAVLLSVSRIPQVMADDKLLPAKLHELHPRFKTPWLSIVVCAIVVSLMILWTFTDLIIIDVTLYGAGLFVEFIALIALRIKMPQLHRPFKIPLDIKGLCIAMILPVGVYIVALSGAFMETATTFAPALFAVIALLSAELVWRIIVWRRPGIKNSAQ